jgi:hypothetical protein
MSQLRIVPITLRQAQAYVREHHRHHPPPRGHKLSVGVVDGDGMLRGIATIGRPVSRALDDGNTAEVTRVATDGTFNACSMLYGACRRIARAMGYRQCVTYTQDGESGASLRAASWILDDIIQPRVGWSVPSRPRDSHGTDNVLRYRWRAW